uniref:Variant surface glycoprotein 1125.2922 n=1 Tax=Trypanosoma brucei TaxID=5691 RepID=A0A1J0R915_9TRYP|nr:variant surface glycoprotein 1125.2922 [Trypanosoma brucei]
MKKRTLNSVLVAFVAFQITENNRVDATDPESVTEVKDECDEIEFVLALHRHFDSQLAVLIKAPETQSKALRQLELATAKHTGTHLELAYTLLRAITSARKAAEEASKAHEGSLRQAIHEVSKRIGRLQTATTKQGAAGATYKSAGQDSQTSELADGLTNGCKVTFTGTKPVMGKCTEKPRTTDQIRQAGAELNQMENIPYSPAAQILGYKLAFTIQSKSTPTGNTKLTNKQGCGDDNTAGRNGKGITGINHEAHTAQPENHALRQNGACKPPSSTEMEDSFNPKNFA